MYLRLFFEFFKAGLFAVGGGMATLPFLYDISDKTGWFTHAQLADMIAISESTPGPIGVNMATYVGFTSGGVVGSIVATIGLITPSIIIILIIARFLRSFKDNKYVESAFYGLRPASTGLIAAAGLSVVKIALLRTDLYSTSSNLFDLFNYKGILLAVAIFYFSFLCKKTKKLHPAVFIAASAVIGIVFSFAGA